MFWLLFSWFSPPPRYALVNQLVILLRLPILFIVSPAAPVGGQS